MWIPSSLKNKKKKLFAFGKGGAYGTDDGRIIKPQSLKELQFRESDNLDSLSRSI